LSESGKSILENYLEDPKIERKLDLDILEFCKTNQDQYDDW